MLNFKVTIIILIVILVYKMFVLILDTRSTMRPIPENVKDIYSSEEKDRWDEYHVNKIIIKTVCLFIEYIILIAMLASKSYAYFAKLFPNTLFMQTLSVVLLNVGVSFVIDIIPEYIDTMIIDKKYGISTKKVKTFIYDEIVGAVISFALTFLLSYVFGLLHTKLGNYMIILVALLLVIISLVGNLFVPFFMRIYNKCTPLEDGELKTRLLELLDKYGYKVRKISVMNASKRSNEGNAFFSGMGKFKNIVLFDNIINKLSTDEIVAIFAHELGHGKHKDIFKGFITSIIRLSLIAVVSWLVIIDKNLYEEFGFNSINYAFSLIILSEVILEFVSPIIGLVSNGVSRKREHAADKFACEAGYGEELISALKKLSNTNMNNLNPHPLLVKINYSHPTISLRIDYIEKNIVKEEKND